MEFRHPSYLCGINSQHVSFCSVSRHPCPREAEGKAPRRAALGQSWLGRPGTHAPPPGPVPPDQKLACPGGGWGEAAGVPPRLAGVHSGSYTRRPWQSHC